MVTADPDDGIPATEDTRSLNTTKTEKSKQLSKYAEKKIPHIRNEDEEGEIKSSPGYLW